MVQVHGAWFMVHGESACCRCRCLVKVHGAGACCRCMLQVPGEGTSAWCRCIVQVHCAAAW